MLSWGEFWKRRFHLAISNIILHNYVHVVHEFTQLIYAMQIVCPLHFESKNVNILIIEVLVYTCIW